MASVAWTKKLAELAGADLDAEVSDREWRAGRACAGPEVPVAWFFKSENPAVSRIRHQFLRENYCAHCRVAVDCLRESLVTDRVYGMRAGMMPEERVRFRRELRRSKAV